MKEQIVVKGFLKPAVFAPILASCMTCRTILHPLLSTVSMKMLKRIESFNEFTQGFNLVPSGLVVVFANLDLQLLRRGGGIVRL